MTAVTETIRPPAPPKPVEWMQKNLFSNWFNTLLTLIAVSFIYFTVITLGRWLLFTADWRPVTTYPVLFLVGQYPREELWRPGLSLLLSIFLVGMSWGVWEKYVKVFAIFLGALLGILALIPLDTQTFTPAIRATFL